MDWKRLWKKSSVFKKRILVLGDSHYVDENDILNVADQGCDFTSGVIFNYLDEGVSAFWKSTFTKFMSSFVLGRDQAALTRDQLWNSVIFYNYLQIPAGNASRLTQYFDYSEERDKAAFLEVIEEFYPDVVIIWGSKVWDSMPNDFGYGNYYRCSKYEKFCCVYPFKNGEIKVVGITHPSTAYNSDYWSGLFTTLELNE